MLQFVSCYTQLHVILWKVAFNVDLIAAILMQNVCVNANKKIHCMERVLGFRLGFVKVKQHFFGEFCWLLKKIIVAFTYNKGQTTAFQIKLTNILYNMVIFHILN